MSFTSFFFLAFLAVCAGLFRVCPCRFRAVLILAASYLIYGTWSPPGAIVLAVLTLITYAGGLAAGRARTVGVSGRTAVAVIALLACCLAAFKLALLTPGRGIGGLVMPMGISYYTFRLISYVLDVHWGKIDAERRLVQFAAYVAFFPQMVAGPIQRAPDFLSQMPLAKPEIGRAVARLGLGLAKKLLIADNLAPAVTYIFGHAAGLNGAALGLGFYLFPLEMYADFSGLTDIAIGAGMLFGIRGPENFNRPFTASNVTEYWRRWHMSLTTWLGDYVFTPLRMTVREWGSLGMVFSTTVNTVAIGLWHGLTSGFLAFGLLHAVYLSTEALTVRRRNKFFKRHLEWDAAASWLGAVITFHLVAIGLIFWRLPQAGDGVRYVVHLMRGWSGAWEALQQIAAATGEKQLLVGIVGYLLLELCERYRPDLWLLEFRSTAPRWVRWSFASAGGVGVAAGLCLMLLGSGGKPARFLYEIF